ncbi:MAG: sulfite exporter TauE/SafE family protein, partial [Myxococcales bacterium]
MPATEVVLLLILAGLCAGFVDAVVGGGGLIQLPALAIAFPDAATQLDLAANIWRN